MSQDPVTCDAERGHVLRDLPFTPAVQSWTSHVLLRVFPAAFDWSGDLLTEAELAALCPDMAAAPEHPALQPVDQHLITALTEDGRASYTDLARRADTTALTARRRLEALVGGQVLRLATEVDLARLGIRTVALLWITVAPGGLEETGRRLSRHPQLRFASATTDPANLLVAVAAADLDALYHFVSDTIGALEHISTVEVTPILSGVNEPAWCAWPASEPATRRPPQRHRNHARHTADPSPAQRLTAAATDVFSTAVEPPGLTPSLSRQQPGRACHRPVRRARPPLPRPRI